MSKKSTPRQSTIERERYVNWNSNIKDFDSTTSWFKNTFPRQTSQNSNDYEGNVGFYNSLEINNHHSSNNQQFDQFGYFNNNHSDGFDHIVCEEEEEEENINVDEYIVNHHSQPYEHNFSENISDLIKRFTIYLTKGDTSLPFNNINQIEKFRNDQLLEIMNHLSENCLHLYFPQLNALNQTISIYTQNCIGFTINSNCIIFKYTGNVEFILNYFVGFEKIVHIVLSLISTDIYLPKYDSDMFENAFKYFKKEIKYLDKESTWFIKLCRALDQNYNLDLNTILKIIDEQKICMNEVTLFLQTCEECRTSIGWAAYWSTVIHIILDAKKYERIQDEIGKIRMRLYNSDDKKIFDLKLPFIYEEVLLATMAIWNVKLFVKQKNIYENVISNPIDYFKKTIESLEKDIINNKVFHQ